MARADRVSKTTELPSHVEIPVESVTIGIDLGDRYSHCCILRADGTVLTDGRLRTTPEAFARQFEGLRPTRITLEVGTHSRWVSQRLATSATT